MPNVRSFLNKFSLFSDGISRSGTFCALYSVLERVKFEQVVDVFQAIKAMRIQQQGLVKTVVCHSAFNCTLAARLMPYLFHVHFTVCFVCSIIAKLTDSVSR